MDRRVVITGLGLVTPVGTGVEKAWAAICAGESGIDKITSFDATGFDTQIAGEVKDFNVEDFLPKKEAKRIENFVAFAIAAGKMAVEDAGLVIDEINGNRIGVSMGCGLGGLGLLENTFNVLRDKGPKRITPFFIPMIIGNMAPGMMSIYLGAKGPNLSLATACAAGTHAVGEAYKAIQTGAADAMIAGGVESTITASGIAGFNAMKALSTRNDEPQKASRPFDKGRDGFVPSEGSGVVILETLEAALARGADIYAELLGFGMSGDGYDKVAPAPNGEGMARCMAAALTDGNVLPEEIDYINAHGTSTQYNDLCETTAIKTIFKDHAKKLCLSSTKSMTGHLLGGAGGVETVFTALSVKNDVAPPTINLDEPDEACDLDYVPNTARKMTINKAMSNSFGFGGTNGSLILGKLAD